MGVPEIFEIVGAIFVWKTSWEFFLQVEHLFKIVATIFRKTCEVSTSCLSLCHACYLWMKEILRMVSFHMWFDVSRCERPRIDIKWLIIRWSLHLQQGGRHLLSKTLSTGGHLQIGVFVKSIVIRWTNMFQPFACATSNTDFSWHFTIFCELFIKALQTLEKLKRGYIFLSWPGRGVIPCTAEGRLPPVSIIVSSNSLLSDAPPCNATWKGSHLKVCQPNQAADSFSI